MGQKEISNEMGTLTINQDVIATHAGMAALDCFGIVGMAMMNMKDGIVHLLKKESAGKGVHIILNDDRLYIEMHIIVAYGVSIPAVTKNLIQAVTYKVEHFTGCKVDRVVVCVDNVRVID
ncbi:MAG: Asp23/Gls24 family envelope stress response protein [Lachnospiraceae bacterium]|nr:Asp23/Gls24 family envelope stress response protein [Lachnospiraceae bacterium]